MDIGKNIRMFREERRISQKALGARCGKAESTIGDYESGRRDIFFSTIEKVASALGVSTVELIEGKKMILEEKPVELRIYNLDDRMMVTQILVKNGYTISQGKRQKSPTGKTMDYFLRVSEDAGNADTSK